MDTALIAIFIKTYRKSCKNSKNWDKASFLSQVKPYPIKYLKFWALLNLPLPIVQFILKIKAYFKK